MIAAELRGGNKPSLNEALGWIGSRVDDIYGVNVGRLEDVWIDPGTGVPRWLLVKEGRFGGRATLIPFEDATAGAGHVWVPYEREIVAAAPEIEPGAPLTQQVEAALRSHYAANAPSPIAHGQDARAAAPAAPPDRPAPPVAATNGPEPMPTGQPGAPPQPAAPAAADAALEGAPTRRSGWQSWQPQYDEPQPEQPQPERPQPPAAEPTAAPGPAETLTALADSGAGHYVEIELSGELRIRGELRSVRVIPRDSRDGS